MARHIAKAMSMALPAPQAANAELKAMRLGVARAFESLEVRSSDPSKGLVRG